MNALFSLVFGELTLDGLVDTGALFSAIPEADLRKFRLYAPLSIIKEGPAAIVQMMVANGQLENPKSTVELKFEVGDIEFHEIFEVYRIHMPQKWKLSSSVHCIFCKTSADSALCSSRIVMHSAIRFMVHTVSKINTKQCFYSCVKWKPVNVRNCRRCKVVVYCILITTRFINS